jgi:hypothetical protein
MNDKNKKADMIVQRAALVKSILDILHCAMQSDDQPGRGDIENVVYAARELLSVDQ